MRIAVIGTRGVPASYSGIERHVEEIGARHAAAGNEVVVFCRRGDVCPPEHRGMRLVHLPALATKHLETISRAGLATAASLRGFDVVHFHAVGPTLLSPATRWASRAAVVATVHGRDGQRAKWGRVARTALGAGEWTSARMPDATIVVSRELQRFYETRFHRTPAHVPNGVTPPAPAADPDVVARWGLTPGRYALFVGRLVPEKGLHTLLDAWRRVDTPLRLALVGGSAHTDDYVERLRRQAADDDRVVLTGPVYGDDCTALYQGAALFSSAADLEAAPLTVLEAASHRLPLVVSDIPAHREDVDGDRPGWRLVPAGDVDALAKSLQAVVDDLPAERAAAAELGARVAADHDWDAVAAATLDVYDAACRVRAARRPRPPRARGR